MKILLTLLVVTNLYADPLLYKGLNQDLFQIKIPRESKGIAEFICGEVEKLNDNNLSCYTNQTLAKAIVQVQSTGQSCLADPLETLPMFKLCCSPSFSEELPKSCFQKPQREVASEPTSLGPLDLSYSQ
jgi:hypothetical protein